MRLTNAPHQDVAKPEKGLGDQQKGMPERQLESEKAEERCVKKAWLNRFVFVGNPQIPFCLEWYRHILSNFRSLDSAPTCPYCCNGLRGRCHKLPIGVDLDFSFFSNIWLVLRYLVGVSIFQADYLVCNLDMPFLLKSYFLENMFLSNTGFAKLQISRCCHCL